MMHVKEAAVYINNLAMSNKNKVRLPWQLAFVKAVSVTHGMHYGPHDNLGLRIAISNTRHVEAPLLRG
jgi:hypothetical protein